MARSIEDAVNAINVTLAAPEKARRGAKPASVVVPYTRTFSSDEVAKIEAARDAMQRRLFAE
jgi:hypothetical protein